MQGNDRVEELMVEVRKAITRHIEERTPAFTDIYNRAYEAILTALKEGK